MKKNKLINKTVITSYFLINFIDVLRIGYMVAFVLFAGNVFGNLPTTKGEIFGLYSTLIFIIFLTIGLIGALILAYFNNYKIFLILSGIDYAFYMFLLIFMGYIGFCPYLHYAIISGTFHTICFFAMLVYFLKNGNKAFQNNALSYS